MITITPTLALDESEVHTTFIRASGPGGQNVNKLATAAQLRFDVRASPSLPDDVRERLLHLADRRMTTEGVLIITASQFRTQERNRQDAIDRLVEIIRASADPPPSRRATRVPRAAQQSRLEHKHRRGAMKRQRRVVPEHER